MWHSRKRMFKILNVNWTPLITSNRVTPRYLTEAVRFFQSYIVSRWCSRSLSLNEKERPVATPPPLVKRRSLSFFRSMSECQDETAPSSPAKSPTSRYKQGLLCLACRIDKQGAFSYHDDDGIRNVTNLHIWQWKIVALHALHVHISFSDIFADVLVLSTTWNDLFWRRERMMKNVQFCLLISEALVPL